MDDTQKYEESYDVSNDTAVGNDSAEPLFTMPPTEKEMMHCKHCDFQAENWPAFSKHVFTQSHLTKIAPAYNIRLLKDQVPVSSTFTCEVCIVECKGHKPWVSHLLGAKHRKALEQIAITKAEQKSQALKNRTGGGGPIKSNQFGNIHNKKPYDRMQNTTPKPSHVPSLAAHDFAQYPEPLIGLEYLTEIQVAGQNPRYECSVCNMKFDHNLKFPHLVGQKHRLAVLKIKRPNVVRGAASKKRSEVTSILMRESAILESEEGRQQVKTKVEDPPFDYSQVNNNTSGRGSTRGRGNKRGRGLSRGNTSSRGSTSSRGLSRNSGSFQPRGGYNMGQPAMSHNYDSYNSSYNSYHNDSYGMTNNPRFDYSSNQGNYVENKSYGYPEQAYSGSGHEYSAQPPQMYSDSGNMARNESHTKEGAPSSLASALGDLTKLVQNEDDASVALQVSNALTQALLQYRMGNEAHKE